MFLPIIALVCIIGLVGYFATTTGSKQNHVWDVVFWTSFLALMFHYSGVVVGH